MPHRAYTVQGWRTYIFAASLLEVFLHFAVPNAQRAISSLFAHEFLPHRLDLLPSLAVCFHLVELFVGWMYPFETGTNRCANRFTSICGLGRLAVGEDGLVGSGGEFGLASI